MTARRVIPAALPALRERNAYSRQLARGQLMRDISRAQNYIWARAYRVYANSAYEGNGSARLSPGHSFLYVGPDDFTHLADEPTPDGQYPFMTCMASFACPPNWGPSNLLKVQGRSTLANTEGDPGIVYVGVYELDGTALNIWAFDDYTADGANEWAVNINVPRDRTTQVRVFLAGDFPNAESLATHELIFISARYNLPTAADIGGDTPIIGWKALYSDTAGAVDDPFSSAVLVNLIRDTNSLLSMRPPEICQSYIGRNYVSDAGGSYEEVGRYKVYIPPLVTDLAGRLVIYCTHGGTGNAVRVLVNGVEVAEYVDLPTGETDQTVSGFVVTPGAEAIITVEAATTAAGADWGTMVLGVAFWEEAVDLALPGGMSVPASYQPLDEQFLTVDKAIVAELNGTAVAGLRKLLENNTWLARHRLRWLVGDWRHRALKRIDTEALDGGAVSTNPYIGWDWTRGPMNVEHRLYHPKNITIIGNDTTLDEGGFEATDDKDGIGAFPFGYSTDGGTVLSSWPISQEYRRHGRRVGRYRTDAGTDTQAISIQDDARIRWLARGRRLEPAIPLAFDGGTQGPKVEDVSFIDQGYFAIGELVLRVISGGRLLASGRAADSEARWYGPGIATHDSVGESFNVVGRCPLRVGAETTNVLEGMLFEMELQSSLIMDDPLPQSTLDAL